MTHRFAQNLIPTIHYYCNRCYSVVEKKDKTCGSCGLSLTRSGSIAYFLQLRLASQLASLWKNRDVCDTIRSHRFQHFAENKEKLLKDIYDGLLYQKLFSDNGLLSDPNNISLSLNTDGAPIFKSSNVSIWPVYLLINELPIIAQRKKRSNSLFYGIWISSSKPIMWAFLKPLYEELDLLETKGYSFTDHKGEEFISKCVLLTCTCDLPARALVYNCNQFNGGGTVVGIACSQGKLLNTIREVFRTFSLLIKTIQKGPCAQRKPSCKTQTRPYVMLDNIKQNHLLMDTKENSGLCFLIHLTTLIAA